MKIFSPCSLDWWLLGYAGLAVKLLPAFSKPPSHGLLRFFLAALLLGTSRYASALPRLPGSGA